MSEPYSQQQGSNWTEQRINTLQNQVAGLRESVARLEERTSQIYEQNKLIMAQLDAQQSGGSLSNTILSWIALALIVGAAVIFATIYLGGHT